MSLHRIILVLAAFMSISFAIINPYGPTVVSDCVKCINNIVDNEFTSPGLVVFTITKNVSTSVSNIRNELLKSINNKNIFTIEVLSPSDELEVCDQDIHKLGILHVDEYVAMPTADYFIIIIDTYKDFSVSASKLIRSRNWNPFAKFIILLFNFVDSKIQNLESVEKILTCLFKYNAINVVVVLPQSKNYRNAIIYSWQPYDPPKYCGYFNETAKNRLIEDNICSHGGLKYSKDLFIEKVPQNMGSCVLNVLALKKQPYISDNENDANIEKILLNRVLQRFNMTASYKVIHGYRGERENVGDWSGSLKKLAAKEGHVLLGGIFPDFDVHEDFEFSMSYLQDSYTWVVPRALKLPPWVSLLIIFQSFVWYSAIGGFFICVISWRIIGQLCGDSVYNKLLNHCFLNTWISIFGFVAYKRPVKESLRVFFVFLNIYSLLFLTAYQTKLFDTLTNPSYEYQMQTIQELVDSGMKFGGFEELHDLFYNSSDSLDYYIGHQWIDVENITSAMIDVAVHRNFSILCSRLELAHISSIMPQLSDRRGNFKYYAFEESTFTVPMEIIALNGFPFMFKFSRIITLFKESGLNTAIRIEYAHFNRMRRARLLRSIMLDNNILDVGPLSVNHIQGGFLALVLGYVGGTVTLIVEIILNTKYVQRKILHCQRKISHWQQ